MIKIVMKKKIKQQQSMEKERLTCQFHTSKIEVNIGN